MIDSARERERERERERHRERERAHVYTATGSLLVDTDIQYTESNYGILSVTLTTLRLFWYCTY